MKKVFENRMVAHVWAQRNQEEGRSSNRHFYFKGDTIYSYGRHFPIARFTKDLAGNDCVLITDQSYGISMSRHTSYTLQAIPGAYQRWYVHKPDPAYGPSDNLADFDTAIKSKALEAAATKHKGKKARLSAELSSAIEYRNRFAAAFIKKFKALPIPDDVSVMAKAIEAEQKRRAKAPLKEEAKKVAKQLGA